MAPRVRFLAFAGLLLFGLDWQLQDLSTLHRVGAVPVLKSVLRSTQLRSDSASLTELKHQGRLALLAQEVFRFLLARCVALEVCTVLTPETCSPL